MSLTIFLQVHSPVATVEGIISELHISLTEQTSKPFTFQFRDVHIKIRRSTFDEELFSFDSLSSYEKLKPCILNVLLNVASNFIFGDCTIENLKEHITFTARLRTLGFIVDIEFKTVEECEEDEDTTMSEIIGATMEEGPAMVPASKNSIENMLNSRMFEEEEIGETCTVCQEEFSVGFEVKVMPCGHAFHGDCIIKWLQQSHFCPLCRFPMPVEAD
ncbi:hypothetical protein NE237_023142 [Protea cynaroides]|uniref:RING-type domain-containing protein n=1 Tax=Protea cynaroides TaxID=273540 RepID=A0A9Q0HED6_9MAGN|nr:hypothetical protein NE237_023142 [Protea cynaroides]